MQAIILAGGKGTRMKSELPKVLHPLGDTTLLGQILRHLLRYGIDQPIVVVGHGKEAVTHEVFSITPRAKIAEMDQLLGTGYAVKIALPYLTDDQPTFIWCGDMPFISPATLDRHKAEIADRDTVMAFGIVENANDRFGRVVRDAAGRITAIVEAKNATPEQLALVEQNAGFYAVKPAWLEKAIPEIELNPLSGEYYLTDLVEIAVRTQVKIVGVTIADPHEAIGVNSQDELAHAEAIWQQLSQPSS